MLPADAKLVKNKAVSQGQIGDEHSILERWHERIKSDALPNISGILICFWHSICHSWLVGKTRDQTHLKIYAHIRLSRRLCFDELDSEIILELGWDDLAQRFTIALKAKLLRR